jgi:hypothetical protein
MSDNLPERSTAALSVTSCAESAFFGFSAGRYSPTERDRTPPDPHTESSQLIP